MNIIQFRSGYQCYRFRFRLGQDYRIPGRWRNGQRTWRIVRFVQTTRKGFNLLDLETSRCLLSRTKLYDRRWSGKAIPNDQTTFEVMVPAYVPVPVPVPVVAGEEKSS